MATNADKKAGLYFITAVAGGAENSATQIIAGKDEHSEVSSRTYGTLNVIANYAGDIADAASKVATGAEAKALTNIATKIGYTASGLGFAQVFVDAMNHDFKVSEMSAGELLNVAAATASLFPGLQIVGFALAGVSVAYSLYEDKNGKITIGEFFEHLGTKMDDLVKKFKGDEFESVKLNIGKLDAKLLDLLPENSLEQKAVMEQFDQWHNAKILNGVYKGERFFSDNPDVLQYTTAQGEGFNIDESKSKYVNEFLLNLSREIDIHHFLWTNLAKDMHQWNIVTNKNWWKYDSIRY